MLDDPIEVLLLLFILIPEYRQSNAPLDFLHFLHISTSILSSTTIYSRVQLSRQHTKLFGTPYGTNPSS